MIYVGKGTKLDPDFTELSMSSQIVMTLMKPLLNKGYCVTVNNFYNSPHLADILIGNRTYIYGTVRQNRKEMPEELRRAKLKKDEVIAFQRGKVKAMKWKDKKDVCLLSTCHNPSQQVVTTRGGPKKRPKVVYDYNFTMGGVDIVDQHLVDYPLPRKRGKKYYKTVFFYLMVLALWNSYQLYKSNANETAATKKHLKYRLKIISSIIEKYCPEIPATRPGRPLTSPHPNHFAPGHFPMEIPPTEEKRNPSRQ